MRQHGRAAIDPARPRATAICQRCQAMVNHDTLKWQYQYGGLKLINLRILVCPECYDEPQVQLRTIILPPDPEPISFPLPELYPGTDNPVSGIGFSPQTEFPAQNFQLRGSFIGTLLQGGGLAAAFDGAYSATITGSTILTSSVSKPARFSAQADPSISGLNNFIGMNWAGNTAGIPASIAQTQSYSVTSFTLAGPRDATISGASATSIQLQGSSDGVTWVTLYSTTSVGSVGEILTSFSSNLNTGTFQQHRFAIQGQSATISVAQAQMNVATTGQNEE